MMSLYEEYNRLTELYGRCRSHIFPEENNEKQDSLKNSNSRSSTTTRTTTEHDDEDDVDKNHTREEGNHNNNVEHKEKPSKNDYSWTKINHNNKTTARNNIKLIN